MVQDSLDYLSGWLSVEIEKLLNQIKNEEDLKIKFETLLRDIREKLNLNYEPKYELTKFSGKRADAVHGKVIIEYKKPGYFNNENNLIQTIEKIKKDYLENDSRAVGIGFDGYKIFFIRNNNLYGPYDFNKESAQTFLLYLRGLSRIPLNAENLNSKFGPESDIGKKAIQSLIMALKNWHPRDIFFSEWKRVFGIVYGEKLSNIQDDSFKKLKEKYKIRENLNFQELLFAIHTYLALLMKIIVAEILTLKETSLNSSLVEDLSNKEDKELKEWFENMENGKIYTERKIKNFLEGDFFAWYLDCFNSPDLKDTLRRIIRELSGFEPATSIIDPNSTRDLLKKLYQYLIPKEIRHRLGEYYTPDWLAELVIKEVGYNGDINKRILDPACGSGTFLVLAIKLAIENGRKNKLPNNEIVNRIVRNIWGFDLNPLAVIAARTNYIFALGDLITAVKDKDIEIPIYLTDSILTRKRGDIYSYYVQVFTSIGEFRIPIGWIQGKGFILEKASELIEEMIKNCYSTDEAMNRLKEEGLLGFLRNDPNQIFLVRELYNKIKKLEEEGKNGIWLKFIKNAFAPMMAGEFDFVVGNPPWIRWDYLSQEYRKETKPLWKDYKIFSLKGYEQMLGGAKPDFSMLFVYASSDYYLKDGGKLGFLITQEVFKSKGAGEGFRRFQLGDGKYLKVLKAHDLVSIQPFEGATNKTAIIILKKGEKTQYPVSYFIWTKKKGIGKIPTDKSLNEVLRLLKKEEYNAKPIGSDVGPWQTFSSKELEELSIIKGKNFYKAVLGANPNPYGVFWIEIKKVLPNGDLMIRNLTEEGKLEIQSLTEIIEQDLVYPAIRGSDIERWYAKQNIFILLVNDPNNPMSGYEEEIMKNNYPKTFNYLVKFKDILMQRALYKKFHKSANNPFYSQYNIGKYTFSPYKVVWKAMSNDIYATVISSIKTKIGYKIAIPLHTTSFFATNSEDEAHYLCAIINSKPVRSFIKSFSSAGRGFGTPSVMNHIGIPKFDPKNQLHKELAEISKQCHKLKLEGKEEEIKKLEIKLDNLVLELFKGNKLL
ncbi:MAG: N-6 DNA methylase [candidate division WOR-3 bacterium]